MIKVDNLNVFFEKEGEDVPVVSNMNYTINDGEIMGIVGESGCGKSISSLALLGLLPEKAKIKEGRLTINKKTMELNSPEILNLRGSEISMIFQEPMTALNPLMIVGKQISEAYQIQHKCTKKEAYDKTLETMRKVGLSRVEELYKNYPHQLSGGMRQRIVIAIALINNPSLIIADEPTTALDVTIQAQILDLIKMLNKEEKKTVVFISHDLALVKGICNKILVMYAGYIVEEGTIDDIFINPLHPYTIGLLKSIPTREMKGQHLFNIEGIVPDVLERRHGSCCFFERCKFVQKKCHYNQPQVKEFSATHKVRCFINMEENQ